MPSLHDHLLAEIHDRLGYQRRGLLWAKVEIVLGLVAAGIGVLVIARAVDEILIALGLLLFVLGGYLTLAGQRSHLYRADLERTALLIDEIRRANDTTQVSSRR